VGRLVFLALWLAGCAAPSSRAWSRAEALWRDRDPAAWSAWRALDASTAEGADARRRLAEADAHFRRGIDALAAGRSDARDQLRAGQSVAPMDPALYLSLARACRQRELGERAAEFYRKFLLHDPPTAEVAEARAELAALDDRLDQIFDAPPPKPLPILPVELALGAVLVLIAALLLARRRAERKTLAQLAQASPELQPAIAFLVGCLRHELLKQRILVAGDAIAAVADGGGDDGRRAFLFARLFRGEPLTLAWAGMLASFMRALGPRFDLQRNDPLFRSAGRAIAEIASLESAFRSGDASAPARLKRAFDELAALDRALATMLAGLTHTSVDDALLAEVVAGVREEFGAHAAAVEIVVEPVAPGVAVEMYGMDLRLVLRNLVRNAVAAALRAEAAPRVSVGVAVALEPTGEELVRLCVCDSNPEPLSLETARDHSRGLGLITGALLRYDGCLEQGAAAPPYAKSVTARLFRALDSAAEAAA
jgi:signal transduction histidine kinase